MAESIGGYLRNRRTGQINPGFAQTSSYQSSQAFAQDVGSPTGRRVPNIVSAKMGRSP